MKTRRYFYCLLGLFFLFGSSCIFAAIAPKITNDAEHNSVYRIGAGLISPHMMLLGQSPKLSEKAKADLRNGIEYLRAVTDYNPENWSAFWISGKASQALGDRPAANKSFKRAYSIQPNNPDVAREYALSCIDLGFGPEAVQAARQAIALSPKDGGLYANLALANLISNENNEALKAINTAINIDPNDKISQTVKKIVIDVLEGNRPQPKTGADF